MTEARPRVIVRRTEVEVEFHQVDMMQVVHNSWYFRWFEHGRMQILDEVIPVDFAVKNKIAMPVVVNHCEYLYPASYGDRLVVTSRHRIAPTWTGRFRLEHSISNIRTKVELCRGYSEVTVVDFNSKRPVRELDEDIWKRYQDLK